MYNMKTILYTLYAFLCCSILSAQENFKVYPISHATAVFEWDDLTIYLDPTGGEEAFNKYDAPDIILVTDIHGDHLDVATLEALNTARAKIVAPKAVADKLPAALTPKVVVLDNGEVILRKEIAIEAVPMYNLREEARNFHTKGRGNGYTLEKDGLKIYISGDTEDIPEMRSLEDIDKAFVCMNLPYTMTVESAADAVNEFKPKQVYPYHYRGKGGLSDIDKFAELIKKENPGIEVVQLDWYPGNE